jgi:hypothetical protein
MLRVGAKLLMKDAIYEFFASKLKWILGERATENTIADAGLILEINSIIGVNLFLLRKCFYSFALESLAD